MPSKPVTHNDLTDQIRSFATTMEFASCPECDSQTMVRLPDDWQAQELMIPIVGCGNPWHYATKSLGDYE